MEHVVIHYEPQTLEYLRIAVPLADTRGTLSSHFGESPYFAILLLRLRDRRIEKKDIVENPHTDVEKAKGIRVAEWLVEKKVDEVAVTEDVKQGPGYVFSNAGVRVRVIAADTLPEIFEALGDREYSNRADSPSAAPHGKDTAP